MKVKLSELLKQSTAAGNRLEPEEREKRIRQLDPVAFEVTQNSATERPFSHVYNSENREGIYVDIVSGKPLFCSKDKFDAGCGWPSFTQPIDSDGIDYQEDYSHHMVRVEIRSHDSDSHLGHVFDDGIEPTGLRYCVNGAALRFIPRERMKQEGYGSYLSLFD
jgi:methionine-R-sulfoxide reductase